MSTHFEALEERALFSVTLPVAAAVGQVQADGKALRMEFRALASDGNANLKALATEVKTQPRSKASAVALVKVKAAFAVGGARDSATLARYLAAGQVDLIRFRSAYLAVLKKPTAKSDARLSAAITAIESTVTPEERFMSTVGTGDTNLEAALNGLVAANPTDTNLQTLVTNDDQGAANSYTDVSDHCTTIQNDITTLIDLVEN